MRRLYLCLGVLFFVGAQQLYAQTRLVRNPAVSNRSIAFEYGNDIWIVSRDGGEARRLTSFQGQETNARFSPDGKWVAFSGQYGGNTDVYIVPVDGGEPKRLTWHPGADIVRGWTADGKYVVFSSGRVNAPLPMPAFWTVDLNGTHLEKLPIPRGNRGEFSSDGNYFAYEMVSPWDQEWRNYRGGQNQPIRVLNMKDLSVEKLPWNNSTDTYPSWLGDDIYFLSNRDFAGNVYVYHRDTKQVNQITHFSDYDVKTVSTGGGVVAFEEAGYIHLYDPKTNQEHRVNITVKGDFPWALPHWEDVGKHIMNASLSPSGVRALFEARGEIFTVPTEKGDYINISNNSGAADRDPVWSPDGQQIAWFSDRSGEYQLMIGDAKGLEKPRAIALENPTFYFTPQWSPDSKYILYTDEGINLWYVDVATGKQKKVDTDTYAHPQRTMDPVWSPDGKWIAYAKRLPNQFHAIMVYSMDKDKTYQLTDGLSDVVSPAWDASGKYLWFLASTNFALNTGWLDMSSYDRPVRRGVYLAVLKKDEPSPLLPESDEEKPKEEEKKDEKSDKKKSDSDKKDENKEKKTVTIDFDGIGQRILSIDVPERNYVDIENGTDGIVFYAEAVENQDGVTVHRYNLEKRKAEDFLSPVQNGAVSFDGKKFLYRSGDTWGVVSTDGSPKIGDGKLNTTLNMKIDPDAEWHQIFKEAWRIERDFFYVRNLHGADWNKVYQMYEPMVSDVRHRSDLTYILDMLGGELSVGHSFTGGGDYPDIPSVKIGLLGADLKAANGRYRIARIFTGENWNPDLRAPLSAPGIDVNEGDYILQVNGQDLTDAINPYSLFEGTAGRQTVLRINSKPVMEGSHLITVLPVENEFNLRRLRWVENNRKMVDKLSDGKLAYVWLPNTGGGGYNFFNRYYFAQQDKQGAVIDERFNAGGSAADYMVDIMSRKLHGFFNNPIGDHRPFTSPGAGIWGPKVMVINEMAGSGGDLLPYMFRQMGIGPLVGERTWGGLVGIWDAPPLIDGGYITAPRGGFYDLNGKWAVENEGVSPDIEVEMTPKAVSDGHDPQLEQAVQKALQLLKDNKTKILPEPPPPEKVKRPVKM